MPEPIQWIFNKPKDFRKQVSDLPHNLRPILTNIMYQLSESKNPNILGKQKNTKYGTYHTIRLNDSYRLAYNTNFKTHEIEIIKVGPHD